MHVTRISSLSSQTFPTRPPPLWFVSNGEHTVGPVQTDLLLRGVWFRRIPDDCWVRELTWRSWRALDEVREVRAVRVARDRGAEQIPEVPKPPSFAEFANRLEHASEASEVLTLALNESCRATGASFGCIYRAFRAFGDPVTSCVRGLGMTRRLGRTVASDDPALGLARVGGVVVAPPNAGKVESAIASRFGPPHDLGGVAMVPVTSGKYLLAVIELGRIRHAFRANDVVALEAIARAATWVIEGFPRKLAPEAH